MTLDSPLNSVTSDIQCALANLGHKPPVKNKSMDMFLERAVKLCKLRAQVLDERKIQPWYESLRLRINNISPDTIIDFYFILVDMQDVDHFM